MELRGLEPLTSSMPSTVELCGGPTLRRGNWSPASAVNRHFGRGLVSSLVISVVDPKPDRHRGTCIASLLTRPQRFPRSRPEVQRAADSDGSKPGDTIRGLCWQ
jgi:hypothetical protein